jgi:hypothetical protein
METITKIEGLSDLSIGALEYNTANNVLVVGYQNGNVDLIKGNKSAGYQTLSNRSR